MSRSNIVAINDSNWDDEVERSELPVMVAFTSPT
jgi:hypothetical protein